MRRIARRLRQARMLAKALRHRYQPINAHIVPIRRCNLACAYCNEFDDHSPPVPLAEMIRRIDRLAELGTGVVTVSGGEPLLHPDLDRIIRHIRDRGMIATVITNGYLLSVERIRRLDAAGLDHLQISIDNAVPDEVSKKSLELLDQKLVWLAGLAGFDVTINTVLGAGTRHPADALAIARRAQSLGLSVTVGIIHDHGGQLLPLDAEQRQILEAITGIGRSTFDLSGYNDFQLKLSRGEPNDWRCRAGSRYLYICEEGLVHWCSQQRGRPGLPLEQYTAADLERQYHAAKACAPYCTVGCVHRVAQVDRLRERPGETLNEWFAPRAGVEVRRPAAVQVLQWLFVTGRCSRQFRSAAGWLLGAR